MLGHALPRGASICITILAMNQTSSIFGFNNESKAIEIWVCTVRHITALLWQKEASDKAEISCK